MAVPSLAFLAYVAVVGLLLQIFPALPFQRALMAVANVAFVLTFTHDPLALAPFAGLLVLGYVAMRVVATRKQKLLFILSVVGLLAAFVWLKRYAFVPGTLLLPSIYLTVGMSYVFFRILHLVIDAYQDTLPDLPGPIAFVDYALSFTAFVSGPIQLYPSYRTTESERASLELGAVARALDRIATGFFKVGILSPIVFAVHDHALHALAPGLPPANRIALCASLVLVFPVYLYFNFSGYTDVVIGASRFLRLELPENFNRPFGAEGSLEFWGRWHMTLSNWLKTYVFSPFLSALLRRFPSAAVAPYLGVAAFFVTFFLVGIWHGSTAAFVLFGFMTGLGVSANKLYQVVMIERLGRKPYRALCARPLYRSFSRGLTFCWFGLSLTTFWSSVPELSHVVALLGAGSIAAGFCIAVAIAAILLAVLGTLSRIAGLAWMADAAPAPTPLARSVRVATLAIAAASILVILNAPAPVIVYKGF